MSEKYESVAKFAVPGENRMVSLVTGEFNGYEFYEVASFATGRSSEETPTWRFSRTAEGRMLAYRKCMDLVGYNATIETIGWEIGTVDNRGRVWRVAGHWAANTGTPEFDEVHKIGMGVKRTERKIKLDGGAGYREQIARMFGGRS